MTLKTQSRQSPITVEVEKEMFSSIFGRYNRYEQLVNGLRDQTIAGEVKIYKMNPDGTRGEYLRTEYPE